MNGAGRALVGLLSTPAAVSREDSNTIRVSYLEVQGTHGL